ncbi:MAG: BtpA/SgcQ family protein [Proteobacteria bacterium]|nr:BtpA/SgcQ family protein [Pseudomonadota bacterium]
MSSWSTLLKTPKIVIGMIHLPPLLGSPGYAGDVSALKSSVLRDVEALEKGGVHAIMMENFGDVPFASGRVGAETVASMAVVGADVTRITDLPVGINVLRNDGESAMAIACAIGAAFIRVNVLSGARVTDQGVIQGIAYDLMRLRARLNAPHIAVLADVDVKHSAPLSPRPIKDEVEDAVKRGLADALIVSGAGTGKETDPEKVVKVTSVAGKCPVFLGSGVTVDNVNSYLALAKGFIVGTAFKENGVVSGAVDVKRVKAFMKILT